METRPKPIRSQARALVSTLLDAIVDVPKSVMTRHFGECFAKLPRQVQVACHEKYHRWRKQPPTLNFEPKFGNYFVVEVLHRYHAIAQVDNTTVTWLWIGIYDDYTRQLRVYRQGRSR